MEIALTATPKKPVRLYPKYPGQLHTQNTRGQPARIPRKDWPFSLLCAKRFGKIVTFLPEVAADGTYDL
jgi:hypothetical protein